MRQGGLPRLVESIQTLVQGHLPRIRPMPPRYLCCWGMKARGYPSESSLIPISAVDTFRLTYTPIFRRLALRAFELAGRLP